MSILPIHRGRRTAVAIASTAAAVTLLAAPPAVADTPAPSRVTARASAAQVSSGEQFVIHGRMMSEGRPVAGAPVRLLARNGDRWTAVKGARVRTGADGRYRVRVVLLRAGDRRLRVVANPAGDTIRTARRNLVVEVGR